MRDFTDIYDRVYIDIDDTLIYGFFTWIMHITWEMFHSSKFSAFLMFLQAKFNLYKVNQKLLMMLKDYSKVTFLTVRAPNVYTRLLLMNILQNDGKTVRLIELGTDNGKYEKALRILQDQIENQEIKRVCIIDDNKEIRDYAMGCGTDAFDPVAMRECVK